MPLVNRGEMMDMEKYQYSIGYVIRNINTVMKKGWKGFSLVREISCECQRLNVDEFEVLRSFAVHKLTLSGLTFEDALSQTGDMSSDALKSLLT